MFYPFFLFTPTWPQPQYSVFTRAPPGTLPGTLKVASELSHERIEEMIQESVAQLEQWAQ